MSWEEMPRVNAHAAYDKHDVIQWDSLPPGECDMNYRLPSNTELYSLPGLVRLLGFAVLLGGLLWFALGLLAGHVGQLVGGMGGTLLLAFTAAVVTQVTTRDRRESAYSFALPIALAGLSVLAASALTRPTMLVAWMAVGWAGMVWIADRVATVNLWWCSANPRVPRATMTAYRESWTHRWIGEAPDLQSSDARQQQLRSQTNQTLAEYGLGVAWLGGAMTLGALAGVASAAVTGVNAVFLLTLIQTTVMLVGVAGLRTDGFNSHSWRRLREAVVRYAFEDDYAPKPPWVLRLPGGPAHLRLIALLAFAMAVGFLATPLTLADVALHPLGGLSVVGAIVLTPVAIVLAVAIVAGPTIDAHAAALESLGFEQRPGTDWDGYVARLHESRNPLERRAQWVGCQAATGFPILIDHDLGLEHVHVVGATGSGKTALAVASDLVQRIRQNAGGRRPGLDIIVDCKGDNALFHTAREEAEAAGRTFKWFTNRPDRETYVFNPVLQLSESGLSLAEQVGVIAQSLSLYHGEGYGRGFFGGAAKSLLRTAYESTVPGRGAVAQRPPIESFTELEEAIRENLVSEQDRQLARQLLDTVGLLTSLPQVNLSGADTAGPFQHAIHLPTAIREGHVLYFHLSGIFDLASVGHLARLVLYSTIAASADFANETRETADVRFFSDESQCLLSQNIEIVLEQARSFGVGCVFAHQNLSQLKLPGGPDLRELVQANTAVKRYHSARDPETQKYLAAVSGRTPYYDLAWDQFKGRVKQGKFGPRYAFGPVNAQTINVQQTIGDRLETQDVADMNRRLHQSALVVERNHGLTQLNGALVIESEYPFDLATYRRRQNAPWPSRPGETLVATSPAAGPQPYPEFDDAELERRMREIRDRLRVEE